MSRTKIAIALVMAAMLTLPVNADRSGLSDPTRPASASAEGHQGVKQTAPSDLKLESILISPNRRIAVINGRQLAEGESADGIEVRHITADTVAINASGKPHLLRHKALTEVKQSKESSRYVSSL